MMWGRAITTSVGFLACASTAFEAHAALFGVQPDTDRIVEIDPSTGTILRSFPSPDHDPHACGLSGVDDGTKLLYQCNNGDLRWIDPISGQTTQTASYYLPDAFSTGLTTQRVGDHQVIALGGRSAIGFWQHPNSSGAGEEIVRFEEKWVLRGALGGDGFGRAFAACFDEYDPQSYAIAEFDPTGESLDAIRILPVNRVVAGLAFDGHFFYAASRDQLLTLNPDTGEILNSVTVPGGMLSALGVAIPEPASALPIIALLSLRRRRLAKQSRSNTIQPSCKT